MAFTSAEIPLAKDSPMAKDDISRAGRVLISPGETQEKDVGMGLSTREGPSI